MEKTDVVGIYERYPPSENRLAEGGLRVRGSVKTDRDELPLVSIITAVRNNKDTLQRCIDSVQNQSHANVEHIVIDGGSTDGTLDTIKRNQHVLDYFISEPDSGIYAAMNKGIRLARGRYLAMINSDDWLIPDGVRKSVRALLESGADFSIGHANVFNEAGEHFHTWKIGNFDDRILISGMSFCHQAVFAHRDCYNSLGLYSENLRICSDYKWVKSLFVNKRRAIFLEEPVVNFSYTGLTVTHRGLWKAEAKILLRESFPFVLPEEAHTLLEFVYRDGPWNSDLMEMLQRGRDNNQFMVSIAMLLMQRLAEAEAQRPKPAIPHPSSIRTDAAKLLRRVKAKILDRARSGL